MSPLLARLSVRGVLVAAVLVAGLAAWAAVWAVDGGSSSGPFAWFRATATPPGWHELALADGAALAYPPALSPVPADPGAVSAERRAPGGGYAAYLNATPWGGGPVPLHGWAAARLDRLADENRSVHEDGAAEGLAFRSGGRGSCVADRYITRVGGHLFAEIACLVRSPSGTATVLVAAASLSSWPAEQPTLRSAVAAFRA